MTTNLGASAQNPRHQIKQMTSGKVTWLPTSKGPARSHTPTHTQCEFIQWCRSRRYVILWCLTSWTECDEHLVSVRTSSPDFLTKTWGNLPASWRTGNSLLLLCCGQPTQWPNNGYFKPLCLNLTHFPTLFKHCLQIWMIVLAIRTTHPSNYLDYASFGASVARRTRGN